MHRWKDKITQNDPLFSGAELHLTADATAQHLASSPEVSVIASTSRGSKQRFPQVEPTREKYYPRYRAPLAGTKGA